MTMPKPTPYTPLAAPSSGGEPQKYVRLGTRFAEHAVIERAQGNRLQASEKIWAMVAQALKAVAASRGWRHRSHGNLRHISDQLGEETGLVKEFGDHYRSADEMHQNFYENTREWSHVVLAHRDALDFVKKLDSLRRESPKPFTIDDDEDQRRVAALLGIPEKQAEENLPIGTASAVGFSRRHREPSQSRSHPHRWRNRGPRAR